MLLSQIKESVSGKFILCWGTDDGVEFDVYTSTQEVGAFLQDLQNSDLNFIQIESFQGDLVGMAHSGRGDIYFKTTGPNKTVFSYEDGEVFSDDLGLVAEFDLELGQE